MFITGGRCFRAADQYLRKCGVPVVSRPAFLWPAALALLRYCSWILLGQRLPERAFIGEKDGVVYLLDRDKARIDRFDASPGQGRSGLRFNIGSNLHLLADFLEFDNRSTTIAAKFGNSQGVTAFPVLQISVDNDGAHTTRYSTLST